MAKRKYTQEHIDFLSKHKTLPRRELLSLFNQTFHLSCSIHAIRRQMMLHGLANARRSKAKRSFSEEELCFIKRNVHLGNNELYSRFIEHFGKCRSRNSIVCLIRDRDLRGGKRPRYVFINGRKISLQQLVWEAVNGPLPKGQCVIFMDGDCDNFSISNIKAIPRPAISMAAHLIKGNLRPIQAEAYAVCALRYKLRSLSGVST